MEDYVDLFDRYAMRGLQRIGIFPNTFQLKIKKC